MSGRALRGPEITEYCLLGHQVFLADLAAPTVGGGSRPDPF